MEAAFCVQAGAQPVGFVFLKHNNKLARLLVSSSSARSPLSAVSRSEWERFSMQWESGLGELAGVQRLRMGGDVITDDKCAQCGTALRTLPLPPPCLPVLCQPALDTWSCSAIHRFLESCQGPSAPGTKAGDGGSKTLPHQAAALYWDFYPGSKVWPRKGMVGVYIPEWDTGHEPAIAGHLPEPLPPCSGNRTLIRLG